MPKVILFDEFHITVYAPRDLPRGKYLAMGRTLQDWRFRAALTHAIRRLFGRYASLNEAAVRVSQ